LRSDHDQEFFQRFEASLVENGHVTIRTMRLTPIGTLVAAILLAAMLWLAAPAVIGRALRPWEVSVAAAMVLAILQWLRVRRLRREREQTESLRDSALW
jgi:membrane protein implicated in regulation of membrane protease activity